jgi:hypothetical protein
VVPPRSPGRIDSDDVRAVLGEHQRDERTSQVLTEIDYSKPGESVHLT